MNFSTEQGFDRLVIDCEAFSGTMLTEESTSKHKAPKMKPEARNSWEQIPNPAHSAPELLVALAVLLHLDFLFLSCLIDRCYHSCKALNEPRRMVKG